MELDSLIRGICAEFSLDYKESKGSYILIVNDQMKIYLEELEGTGELLLYTYLFPVIETSKNVIALKFLEENAFGKITGSGVISISNEHKRFILSQRYPLKLLDLPFLIYEVKQWIEVLNRIQVLELSWAQSELEIDTENLQNFSLSKNGDFYVKG